MDNKDQNYGQHGSELWITRIRIIDSKGQNYGQQGSGLWTSKIRSLDSNDSRMRQSKSTNFVQRYLQSWGSYFHRESAICMRNQPSQNWNSIALELELIRELILREANATTRIRILDNKDRNFGQQGLKIWTTRIGNFDNKGPRIGQQGFKNDAKAVSVKGQRGFRCMENQCPARAWTFWERHFPGRRQRKKKKRQGGEAKFAGAGFLLIFWRAEKRRRKRTEHKKHAHPNTNGRHHLRGGKPPPAPPRSKKIILGGARFFCFFFQVGKLK